MKKLVVCCLLLSTTMVATLTLKKRMLYFAAPAATAYTYNKLTYLMHPYTHKHQLEKLLWYNNPVLFLAFQALTHYCWSQTFSTDDDTGYDPNVHIMVTTRE